MASTQLDLTNADTKNFFDENGFALFKNVFSQEEVKNIREELFKIFEAKAEYPGDWDDKPMIKALRADLFNRYEKLRWAFYKPAIHEALKKVLGNDIGFVPESVAHYKGFGTWHKDTTSQENDGVKIQHDPNWLMVECAIYLQDNSLEYGGGLDVVPGTHKKAKDNFLSSKGLGYVSSAINRVKLPVVQEIKTRQGFHIPGKAGDFIFFNKKLDHRSSPCNELNVPRDKEKLAIFFIGGVNNEYLGQYTEYIKTRPSYVYMKDYNLNPDFKKECEERNINLVDPAVKQESGN